MLRVLACVTQEHEPWLVTLAVLVCLAGMFTFVRLLRGGLNANRASQQRWIGTAAVAGAGTIWATHFIAMLAHRSAIPMAFDVTLTFGSVAVALGLTWAGVYIAVTAGYTRHWALVVSGCVIGVGIGAMHHIGMLALAVPGTLLFDPAYVASSVVIGCAFSTAAVWVTARRDDERHNFMALFLFTLAIAGHHFTSLAGTAIVLDGRPVEGWLPDGAWLAVAVAVAAAMILAICAGASVIEQNLRLRIANENRMRELSLQSLRFQAALDNMIQGLCLFDAQKRLIVHNRRFAALFGTPSAGATAATLQADLNLGDIFGRLTLGNGESTDGYAHQLPDGRIIQVSRQSIPGAGWVATYEDITERRRTRDQLSHMARHDALTGLANRMKFREHMEDVLSRIRGGAAVLSLDLDGFKDVNDTFGHPVGDELLRAVAARLKDCTRETDLVGRLGGDEFAILQTDAHSPTEATTLSDRLIRALDQPFVIDGHHVVIGTSIGIALADEVATADGLLRNADLALYRAKESGRGTWRVFEPEMDNKMQARRTLEADLRRALAEGQFEVFYQPLIDASTETLTGFEALLRWNHPERGVVSPAEFIPVSEEMGLICGIGAWVLKRACADAALWPLHIKVAVNLSPVQFLRGNLVREVEDALVHANLVASRLELEITESVLLQDNDTTLGILHRLRSLGVRISMDDFGTGYSSLGYLRRFPFDKIKIDQSFVRNSASEKGCVEIIRAVVGLGRALSMQVLAEGVETVEQFRMLQNEGCHELQGYLFSRPKPLRDVQAIIAMFETPANKSGNHARGKLARTPRLRLAEVGPVAPENQERPT